MGRNQCNNKVQIEPIKNSFSLFFAKFNHLFNSVIENDFLAAFYTYWAKGRRGITGVYGIIIPNMVSDSVQ